MSTLTPAEAARLAALKDNDSRNDAEDAELKALEDKKAA